jgi:hypothetical protein
VPDANVHHAPLSIKDRDHLGYRETPTALGRAGSGACVR